MKSIKKLIVLSILSLVLCFTMLLGTTYAWMTDSVQSGKNIIQAGNLDARLYHKTGSAGYTEVDSETPLFNMKNGAQINWEPDTFVCETFKVEKTGDLDMLFNFKLEAVAKTYNGKNLSKVLRAAVVTEVPTETPDAGAGTPLKYFTVFDSAQELLNDTTSKEFSIVIFWPKGENDYTYNLEPVNDKSPLEVTFEPHLIACQSSDDAKSSLGAHPVAACESLKSKYTGSFNNEIVTANIDGTSDHTVVTGFDAISFNKSVTLSNITFAEGARLTPTATIEAPINLILENCVFEAGPNGYCLDIDTYIGDTSYARDISIVIEDCKFIGNHFVSNAPANSCGLILNVGSAKTAGNVTVKNCTFEEISSHAIDLGKFSGTVAVENCGFKSWAVSGAGSAIKGEVDGSCDFFATGITFNIGANDNIKYLDIPSSVALPEFTAENSVYSMAEHLVVPAN